MIKIVVRGLSAAKWRKHSYLSTGADTRHFIRQSLSPLASGKPRPFPSGLRYSASTASPLFVLESSQGLMNIGYEVSMKSYDHDVFLRFIPGLEDVLAALAARLSLDGLRVWRDSRAKPDQKDTIERTKHLLASRVLLAPFISGISPEEWRAFEEESFGFRDPSDPTRRFVPLRLDNCELPAGLVHFGFIDWRQQSDSQYEWLLKTCAVVPKKVGHDAEDAGIKPLGSLSLHPGGARAAAISKDASVAFSGGYDNSVRIWDLGSRSVRVLKGHNLPVWCVALSPDGHTAISGSGDSSLRIWDVERGEVVLSNSDHRDGIETVAISMDGQLGASADNDGLVLIWDLSGPTVAARLLQANHAVQAVALDGRHRRAVIVDKEGGAAVWDFATDTQASLPRSLGHIRCATVDESGRIAVYGTEERTVIAWDLDSSKQIATFEGHTQSVAEVTITPDGARMASCSGDRTVRVWDTQAGRNVGVLSTQIGSVNGIGFSGDGRTLIAGRFGDLGSLWSLPPIRRDPSKGRYTNAKVLLVGDSGVGKSGLAHRMTSGGFVTSSSTDAAWATQLKLPELSIQWGMEREIWLWDFAGQADYRLIHQLYMDETALAVLVFNPQSENPFEGLGQWDRDLSRAARRSFRKILVAGRCDRGGLMVSGKAISDFAQERKYTDYIETSAKTGAGCDALLKAIVDTIAWNEIPWTASPRVFRQLKEQIVRLKDEGRVLLRMSELKQQLDLRLAGEEFGIAQLRAVIGLLAGPGVVWQLEFGDFVLLQPERINAYAAAVIRSVRKHSEEIGCIAEEDVLSGKLDYQDMRRLPADEEEIVLRAMHQTFVDHGLCLREHTDEGTLLIFPSYFKRERPELKEHPVTLISYDFAGPLDEIYATLVVRLHHITAFERDQLWRFAADFRTPSGKRLGIRLIKKAEGSGQLDMYFEPGIDVELEVMFIRYVHDHLRAKAVDVTRSRHYLCPSCGAPVQDTRAIRLRLEAGNTDIICVMCEKRVPLWDLIEEKFTSEEAQRKARQLSELANEHIDNESRELILVGHAYAIAGEAGQIYRQYTNSDHGIDGEIEFKDRDGKASGRRLYLQLKSGDSYLYRREKDGAEVFTIRKTQHAKYWMNQAYPVMLVVRTSDESIRWMNVTSYLRRQQDGASTKKVLFEGESLTATSLRQMRERVLRGGRIE